jgi:hypothetical protein
MAFGTTPSNGTEYALWQASPARKVRGALWGGKRRYGQNAAITLAAGGQINLIRLNVGEVVMGGRMYWDALGSGVQLNLGDAGDCDRYLGPVNGAAASDSQVSAAPQTGDCGKFTKTGIGFVVTATTQDVILTNTYAAATSALAAGAIKVVIELGTE